MNERADNIRLAIGCMTGTSLDALDIALISVGGEGLAMSVTVEGFVSVPLGSIADKLREIAEQKPCTAGEFARLEHEFSRFHLTALSKIMRGKNIDLISLHGQTIYHNAPYSWQLINPAIIANNLKVKTIYNLRAADLALGGEGAPITPLADFILFRNIRKRTAVVNLGGFCNITIIPRLDEREVNMVNLFKWSNEIIGNDICLCNQLLDRISRKHFGKTYDDGGEFAADGKLIRRPYEELYVKLLQQSKSGRSLGSDDSTLGWLSNFERDVDPRDLARTACAAIAAVIAEAGKCEIMILAGGGVHHKTLFNEIRQKASFQVKLSSQFGIDPGQREAVEIAILGLLCQDRVPITLPQITGVKDSPISGNWVMP